MPLSVCVMGSASIDGGSQARQPRRSSLADMLVGLVDHGGSRDPTLVTEVGKATDVPVPVLGGTLGQPGVYALQVGTPMTFTATAHQIGWVSIVKVKES
jgi:hypothetical protein